MPRKPAYLSKSKYIIGLQCPKLLWYMYNRKDKIPPIPPQVMEVMKQGKLVGKYAQKLFPDGITIDWEINPSIMNKKSVKAAIARKPLFEAGFVYNHGYALADILVPTEDDGWDLIEVKSSTSVKGNYLHDAAFQKYVYQGVGLKINRSFIMHLDKRYMRSGEIEVAKLFTKVDVSEQVDELLTNIGKNIEATIAMIAGEEPKIAIGPQCGNDCALKDTCWSFLPKNNIFMLRSGRKIALNLIDQGIYKIEDIPPDIELNEKQSIQVKAHRENKPYIERGNIHSFVNDLQYPLYFLDFETMAPAIPIYDNTHPYEDIPFQFSLHVVKKQGEAPTHHSYLAPGKIDPRPEVLKQLKNLLGNSGSIIAYNAIFEIKCINSAVNIHPEYDEWFNQIKKRFVDLLTPFKDFNYYDPKQAGSASLKYVLPALTGKSYDGLEIMDGRMASSQYLRVTFDKTVDEKERQQVRTALEKYCGLDTEGMIYILEKLQKV
jgi:Domain of unknown function(DUF2779)